LKDRKRLLPDQRLRKQNTFKNLVAKGSFARGRFFCLWIASRETLQSEPAGQRPALGVVVNRKTQARATGRNKLKRRVREIFRKRQAELKENVAVLIKAREGKTIPSSQEAENDLMELFRQAGALK